MNKKCRFCNSDLNVTFLDLGMSPLSNAFLDKEQLGETEDFFPLKAYVCESCFLVQLQEWQIPSKIFSKYAYFSSYSKTWLLHAEKYTEKMIKRFSLNKEKFVVEIASNDGYLLQYFKKQGLKILGIEPAENVADVAIKKKIPTQKKFFNSKTALELIEKYKQPDLIVGNNVLAHVPNLNDFVKGLKILLSNNGVITLEFPHLLKLIEMNQFDTVYHEHFSYFSLFVVNKIFEKHELTIFDVEELPTHGGSLRIYVKHAENSKYTVSYQVSMLINKEKNAGLFDINSYKEFSLKIDQIRKELEEFFEKSKIENKKIVCYGAAAKGNTLLNYCKIPKELILYIVDRSIYKQGLFLPGTHIIIKKPEDVKETKPDYLLILPWNLKDEIIKQMGFIRDWGGKFVIPIPEVKVIS